MKPERFTIATKNLDFMKINERIYSYEIENGCKPYLFMNKDTIDELTNTVSSMMDTDSSGYCGMYCGRKTFCDETMQFGEVEMR